MSINSTYYGVGQYSKYREFNADLGRLSLKLRLHVREHCVTQPADVQFVKHGVFSGGEAEGSSHTCHCVPPSAPDAVLITAAIWLCSEELCVHTPTTSRLFPAAPKQKRDTRALPQQTQPPAACCPSIWSWVGFPAHTQPRTRVGRAAEAHHCPLKQLCWEGWAHSTGTASGAAAAQQSFHELCAQPAPLGPAVAGSTMLGHCSNLLSRSAELQPPQHSPSYI